MAVFYIYADESGKLIKNDYTSFCGYVAHAAEWQRFAMEWDTLLMKWSVPPVHMSKIMSPEIKKDEWSKIKTDWGKDWETNRDIMLEQFASAVRDSGLVCVGAAVDAKHFRLLADSEFKKEAKDPLYLSFHHIVMSAIEKIEVIDKYSPISIVIDDGDEEYSIGCYKLLNNLKKHPDHKFDKVRQRIDGMCFGNDRSYSGLQAADMVAYETRRLLIDRIKDAKAEPSRLLTYLTFAGKHKPGLFTAAILDELESGTLEMLKKEEDEDKKRPGI